MIVWKLDAFNIFIRPVQEIIDGESIRCVHVLGAADRLEHWAYDNIGIDDGQIERWLIVGDELPRRLFRELF